MSDLHSYHNDHFGNLRGFVDAEGILWFVAADVCAALEIRTNDALNSLDEDEKGYDTIVSPGGPQKMALITEPGLYSLILRSRKADAKIFKRWITHEVIPSIRKTGQFAMPQAEQTVTVEVDSDDFTIILKYVSTLRQMARMKAYPDCMRVKFLAEAASLLSGFPMDRFMPPAEICCPLFQ